MGVWDTVASIGLLRSPFKSLPFVDLNPHIRVFRQALALDEHRVKFRPNLYRHGVLDGSPNPQVPGPDPTDALEMWFPGCHADIGGRSGDTPSSEISNIPLRWMMAEVLRSEQDSEAPLLFDDQKIAAYLPNRQALLQTHSHGALAQDAHDALGPITDELYRNILWWLLEFLPVSYGSWRPHLGRRRQLPSNYMIHETVNIRRNNPTMHYKPRALESESSPCPLKILWRMVQSAVS